MIGALSKPYATEGPINAEEVARRISACFGRERAGNRILNVTKRALTALADRDLIEFDDGFYMTDAQLKAPPVRDRSNETGATLKASSISLHEIEAALKIAQDDNAGAADDDLIRAAARLLGFRRVWAAPKRDDGEIDHQIAMTGQDLIDFVNGDLFPYLKTFSADADDPDTIEYKIGEIFNEIINRFRSGYSGPLGHMLRTILGS